MDERAIREAQTRVPPWTELHERQVLAKTKGLIDARRQRGAHLRRGLIAGVATAAAAAGLVAVYVGLLDTNDGPSTPSVQQRATSTSSAAVMALPDKSRAVLGHGALCVVEHHDAESTRLRQKKGRVRYEVRRRPGRTFSVQAHQVRVTAIGTVFSVDLHNTGVHVEVHEGRVEVLQRGRRLELGQGEQLRLRLRPADEDPGESQAAKTAAEADIRAPVENRKRTRRKLGPSTAQRASITEQLARVDRARRNGQLDEATALLQRILRSRPTGMQAAITWFTLGRVQQARGRHAAAAKAFRRCTNEPSAGSLAEDALAEEALCWIAAGQRQRARSAAQRYGDRYPEGIHSSRLGVVLP